MHILTTEWLFKVYAEGQMPEVICNQKKYSIPVSAMSRHDGTHFPTRRSIAVPLILRAKHPEKKLSGVISPKT